MGQWVAQLSRIGLTASPEFELAHPIIAVADLPRDDTGLPEATKKAIWAEAIKAEDRAMKESKDLPPTEMLDRNQELRKKYLAAVFKRYHISEKQYEFIKREGLAKNWPFPKD
jgi:hypothetical protein